MKANSNGILMLLIFTFGLCSCVNSLSKKEGQKDKSTFWLSISTFNHAERLYSGTLSYVLSNDSLTIKRTQLFSDSTTLLFSKALGSTSINHIKNIPLDNLKDFYVNKCVMLTSGNEYYISTKKDTVEKSIWLHHYYEKHVEQLIQEVNKLIPDTLEIYYMTSEMEQDCKY